MRIALFGGSFDPIHNGHLEVVLKARESLEFDKIVVMPAYLSPFKVSTCADATKRLAWVRKVFGGMSDVYVSDYEISQNRSVPTIESVEFIAKYYKTTQKTVLIIGADNVATLHHWRRFDELAEMCDIVVATRSGYEVEHSYKILNVKYDISSTDIRNQSSFDHLPMEVANEIMTNYKKE